MTVVLCCGAFVLWRVVVVALCEGVYLHIHFLPVRMTSPWRAGRQTFTPHTFACAWTAGWDRDTVTLSMTAPG
jgi:hypothetical protein